ncbi:hypothetical protein EKO25_10625 [Bacillus sp. SAJ1]|nr:hypothetical protein EKO25_10625 [Bacillus sp. SAJ1]
MSSCYNEKTYPCTFTYEEVLDLFEKKIKKSLHNTPFQHREDLEQEIKIKIFEKINIINSINPPGFFDFLSIDV